MSFKFISKQLNEKHSSNRYRARIPVGLGVGRFLIANKKKYINFSSNDYLGLADHSIIKKAFINGINLYGSSASSSSLITGYNKAHKQLEELVSDWLGLSNSLLFSSGFAANTAAIHALAMDDNIGLFLDKLSHASLIDAAFNSKGKAKRFNHNNVEHLDRLLSTSSCDDKLTIVEGVYSMDGNRAPIADLVSINNQHQGMLYIDDAHGIGVLGEQGQGSLSAVTIDKDDPNSNNIINMATFGKALGTSGAVLSGSAEFIDFLVNHGREYIYSTAMSPANALATIASIKLCIDEDWRREKIAYLTQLFIRLLDKSIEITPTDSSIVGIIVGDEKTTLQCAEELRNLGFWLTAIRPPTVPTGKSRLRVTINAKHNDNDIRALANSINEVLGRCMQTA